MTSRVCLLLLLLGAVAGSLVAPAAALRSKRTQQHARSKRASTGSAGPGCAANGSAAAGCDPLIRGNRDLALFEIDIILPYTDDLIRVRRAVQSVEHKLWPGGVVPFQMAPGISQWGYQLATEGMDLWMNVTCVVFRERIHEDDYIVFTETGGCWSYVGRTGGPQRISLGSRWHKLMGCGKRGVVLHELAHVLGFWHEQSRVDRDAFVTINMANVAHGQTHNFQRYRHHNSTLEIPYDYSSIMHYNAFAFSMNREKTIVTKDSNATIGQRQGLSALDILKARTLYNCPSDAEAASEQGRGGGEGLSSGPEQPPGMVIVNAASQKCLTHLQNGTVTTATCSSTSPAQQWAWSAGSKLVNLGSQMCLTYNSVRGVHLKSCDNHTTLTQEWACAGAHLKHPLTGVCLSEEDEQLLPRGSTDDELLRELASFVHPEGPPKRALPPCRLHQAHQHWGLLANGSAAVAGEEEGGSSGNGSSVCARSPGNQVSIRYQSSRRGSLLSCPQQNTFAASVFLANGTARGLGCRASMFFFTGEPRSTQSPGRENCSTSQVGAGLAFACGTGQHLKSVELAPPPGTTPAGNGEDRPRPQAQVTCCRDKAQTITLGCMEVVGKATGVLSCQDGYHIMSYTGCPGDSPSSCTSSIICCF